MTTREPPRIDVGDLAEALLVSVRRALEEREAPDAEGDGEALRDDPTYGSEGSGLSQGAEGPNDDEQQNPEIAGMAFPDAGVRRAGAPRGLFHRLLLVSCLCHNHQTYRTFVRIPCQSP